MKWDVSQDPRYLHPEDLPVLGDWVFNLEFLMHSDIYVLDEPLAYYHHRDVNSQAIGTYGNSVIAGQMKHLEFSAVARNKLIRKYGTNHALASALLGGYYMAGLQSSLRRIGQFPVSSSEETSRAVDSAEASTELADFYFVLSHVQHNMYRNWFPRFSRPSETSYSWAELCKLLNAKGCSFPIIPSFDEAAYLKENPDVSAAVNVGAFTSGYEHFIKHGKAEGRPRPFNGRLKSP